MIALTALRERVLRKIAARPRWPLYGTDCAAFYFLRSQAHPLARGSALVPEIIGYGLAWIAERDTLDEADALSRWQSTNHDGEWLDLTDEERSALIVAQRERRIG
jgi:hypothetical protein